MNPADWPTSPIRAAIRPSVPAYMSVPFWRGQLPVLHKVADHLSVATPDFTSIAALAYISSFGTRVALFEQLARDVQHYAVKGKPAVLQFPLEWADSKSGRYHEREWGAIG